MTDVALIQSRKTSAYLFTFKHGDPIAPTFVRYTDWGSPITWLGQRYNALHSIETDIPPNTAGLEEPPFGITLPVNAFTARISGDEPHASIDVIVAEHVISESHSVHKVIFKGKVARAIRNYQGKTDRVHLECANVKQRLAVPMGIPANTHCIWTFGEEGCLATNKAALTQNNVRIVAVADTQITMDATFVTTTPWFRGFVAKDGLRIAIRDHSSFDLILAKPPPRDWLEALVSVVPGCRKTIEACRNDHNNEDHFGGFGIAIPDYHPVVESPE